MKELHKTKENQWAPWLRQSCSMCVWNFNPSRISIDPYQNNPATSHMFTDGRCEWMIEYSLGGELSKRTGPGLVNLADKGVLKTNSFPSVSWSRKRLIGSSSGYFVFLSALRFFWTEEHIFLWQSDSNISFLTGIGRHVLASQKERACEPRTV